MNARENVILLGSSVIKRWPGADPSVVNRGVSGLRACDLKQYEAAALAGGLSPTRVVVYCGGNDARAGADSVDVAADVARFVDAVCALWPRAAVALLAVLRSPSARARPEVLRAVDGINRRLRRVAAARPAVEFIETNRVLTSADYARDGTHLVAAGYRALAARLDSWTPDRL